MSKTTNATAKTRATTKAPAPAEPRKTKKVLTEKDIAPGQPTAKELKSKIGKELAAISAKEGAPRANAAVAKATAMAKGVNGRTAPQSAKAFADAKPAKATAPAKGKATKAAKPERSNKRECKVTLLVKPEDSGVKGGRLAKLKLMWKVKPATVADVLGKTVVDDSGKEHAMDMGAINGMLRRNHIAIA